MIEIVFTIDYEIYGNGDGSLKELVYEPTEKLIEIFKEKKSRFVAFVEAAELEIIEERGSDGHAEKVKHQIRRMHMGGFEIGLHLHPQWYNAKYEMGQWQLDYNEYNLCALSEARIGQIVDRSLKYLRDATGESDYTPLSFRAGNWLFQPAETASRILAERGIKVDSSVFKGGLQTQQNLDYRQALRNGYYWRFLENVDVPNRNGNMLELPIYTRMVPFWRMLTTKRIGIQGKATAGKKSRHEMLRRLPDFLRFRYPLKLDFCRMSLDELMGMMDAVIREDQKSRTSFKPIVAIGHSKDLVDFETVRSFLSYLADKGVQVSTFEQVILKCIEQDMQH